MPERIGTREVEIAVAEWIGVREHLTVPNVSWGMHMHECDILYLSSSGYATEVEIKVSRSDFKRDAEKKHQHRSQRIKYLYFALPLALSELQYQVPEHAGVLLAYRRDYRLQCKVVKEARANAWAKPFTESEQLQMARLGTLRIWALKRRLWESETRACTDDGEFSI